MKTITPSSNEDLVNQYLLTNIEYLSWIKGGHKKTPFNQRLQVYETYKNCLRFLERNIKERGLWN